MAGSLAPGSDGLPERRVQIIIVHALRRVAEAFSLRQRAGLLAR